MTKQKSWFSFRTLLAVLTTILVIYVVYMNWEDILETFEHLGETNIFVLLLLIPEQLMMYYACGQIFFSYLVHRQKLQKISWPDRLRISTELNFVNRAIPVGGIGGLAFLTYRLHGYGVTAGQTSFLYLFRYAVTTTLNYLQALIAILVLLALGSIPEEASWIIPVALLMNFGLFTIIAVVVFIASSNRRINFFAQIVTKLTDGIIRVLTLGRRRHLINRAETQKYFADIHESVQMAQHNKKHLKKPALWGVAYSLLEIATYWIVAISLGRPEILPVIMVAEAIGSVFDGIVPYGLYELGMAGVMIAMGVDFPTATIVTVMTRVLTLMFTIVSGAIPYYKAIRGQRNG